MLSSPSVGEAYHEMRLAGRPVLPIACSSWPIATTLRTICVALGEGLAAHRQYQHLRSKGISHDTAIRQALGISHPGK